MEIYARKCAWKVSALAALIGGALIAASPASRAQSGLPPPLETYLTKSAHLSGDERRALLSGAPVTKLLDSDPSKEVAVLGAVWIAASLGAYVQQMMTSSASNVAGLFSSPSESAIRHALTILTPSSFQTRTWTICGSAARATAR